MKDVISGFVAIMPAGTELYENKFYKKIHIPTVILYGDKNSLLSKKIRKKLKLIPKSQTIEIKNAGHSLYLDNPLDWEKILYNFLVNLLPPGHHRENESENELHE